MRTLFLYIFEIPPGVTPIFFHVSNMAFTIMDFWYLQMAHDFVVHSKLYIPIWSCEFIKQCNTISKVNFSEVVLPFTFVLPFNPLSANFTKWSNTLKQFVGKLPTNCLSVFDHFVGLALKGLTWNIKHFSSFLKTFHWSR